MAVVEHGSLNCAEQISTSSIVFVPQPNTCSPLSRRLATKCRDLCEAAADGRSWLEITRNAGATPIFLCVREKASASPSKAQRAGNGGRAKSVHRGVRLCLLVADRSRHEKEGKQGQGT